MEKDESQSTALAGRFGSPTLTAWRARCRPRILILVDGLSYNPSDAFGLSRFLEAITLAPGIVKPVLTLAHRFTHFPATVTIGPDTYTVVNNFNFATTTPAFTLANYDQAWIFGIGGGGFSLSTAEVAAVSTFMNGGGGFFATGDHASLGRELSGSLPRIRHMREWRDAASGGVPMGLETDVNLAVMRVDTIVNPGPNNLYEFEDQSDNIPQRIYPNYKVVDTDGTSGSSWTATVHPVLMLPGAPTVRSTNADFTNDLDVLPDHPHESQCYEVIDGTVLGANYNLHGQNFVEYQPFAPDSKRPRPEVVAYAVSGGRAVNAGLWKPPVRPRMFGAISAYDGRLAMAYAGNTQPPGRIVCESTWHHYVSINIDGTGSPHTGLGTGTGAGFVPGPDLLKIYAYWRNTVAWLQPANRIWCPIYWELAEARFHAALYEELLDVDRLTGWRDLVGLGREARRLAASRSGRGILRDQLVGLLTTDAQFRHTRELVATGAFGVGASGPSEVGGPIAEEPIEVESTGPDAGDAFNREELLDGIYGALLALVTKLLPDQGDPAATAEAIAAGPDDYVDALREEVARAIRLCGEHQAARLERGREIAASLIG